jgi:hypothetical protein
VASYCSVSDCERETEEGRSECPMHTKRKQRGASWEELHAEPTPNLTPKGRLLEAAIALVDAPVDDDDEHQKRERAVVSAAKVLGARSARDAIKRGMESARRRGIHVGRPAKLRDPEEQDRARKLARRIGLLSAALVLGVSANTLRKRIGTLSARRSEKKRAQEGTLSAPEQGGPREG